MHREMTSITPGITSLDHPCLDSSMPILPTSCEEMSHFPRNVMTPLTPIETMDHPPNTLSPPYTPSSSHSSQSSPHLILSPKDFAPFRAFRRRENVNYSEVKRRTKKSDDVVKPVVLSSPHKRKSHKVKVRVGEWEAVGKPVRKRVYINNSTGGQFRPCFEETRRKTDSLVLREGDDVTAVTVDDEGEKIVGVARVTRIYVAMKSRDLHAALLWYYLPEQVEDDSVRAVPHEIYPSRHLDSLSLRAIENKVEVMNTSQFIQYSSSVARSNTFPYSRMERVDKDASRVYFARYPYDCVRKRILLRERK